MQILLLTGEFPPQQGGVGDYAYLLARALRARGHDVSVLTTQQAAAVEPDAAPVATVSRWDWRAWPTIRATIERLQPDVVLIQYQTAAYGLHPAINLLPGWLRLRLRGRCPRLVTTFHDLKFPYLFPKAGPLRLASVRWLARQSDAAIATNMEDWQTLQQWGLTAWASTDPAAVNAPPDRLTAMIPIGSNIECAPPVGFERDAWRADVGVQPQDWLLCYFGFLNASKGGEVLINSLARLVQHGWPAHLLMIGGQVGSSDPSNERYLAHVREQIGALGLSDRVHWTGFVPPTAVSAHFLAADLCVLPYQDGAGRSRGSLMAALTHGRAIVTTRPQRPLPGFADGENMLWTPLADPQAVAAAVVRVMTEPLLRQRLAAGAQALSQQFTWTAIAAQYLALFGQWQGRTHPGRASS